ncbi:MAG: DUF2155 domain-containing protein [Alphaproteobacteria bacterium]|nr:MAG: DUF2155 domain-containing protein [Alphaproteobacteria bacterium]
MGDARRAACRSAVLQPVRSPVWGAATAAVERAERPSAAGLSAISRPALSRPTLSGPTLPRAALSGSAKSAAAVDPLPGQRQPRGAPQPADTSPQPGDEVIAEPPSQKIANKSAMFSGLDKITGRIIAFDAAIGETVQFGALQVTPRICYTRPPTETPNTDAFIEVDEVTLQGDVKRIFTGWMFAASPGLHAVEHPIYDVWLTDCKNPLVAATAPPEPPPAAAAPPAKPAAPPPRRSSQQAAPQLATEPAAPRR